MRVLLRLSTQWLINMKQKKNIKRFRLVYSTRTNGIVENMDNSPFDVKDKFAKLKSLFK
jgi:Txe/YoeB family toxin of Txe-Axe toxin-antitoxin module